MIETESKVVKMDKVVRVVKVVKVGKMVAWSKKAKSRFNCQS